jgi:hypothetical protein
MRPDVHAGPGGSYRVRSLYYDSPDWQAYHEKLAGVALRHKLRARAYGMDPGRAALVRMEVKSRYLNFIHKIAVDVPRGDYKEIEEAFANRLAPPVRLLAEASGLREFYRLQRLYNAEPKLVIEYRRQAFERREGARIRANFDDEIVAARGGDLLGRLPAARRLLRPGTSIFEIKVDGFLPWWLHQLIAKYDLHAEALSKYCFAVRSEARMTERSRPRDFLSREDD